ncbi:MAG: hypothetical protein LBF16_09785 [Pseudomonadales bacterium]|jgi:ketosteroid isomerase-like protein|nr:hypothetical protein [Pseudomonadales bacterium]
MDNHALQTQVLNTLDELVQFQREQDLPGVLSLMHQSSFAYMPTQQMLMKLFAAYELKLTLLDKKFVAADEHYAFARLRLRTEKIQGPEFRDNTSESLVIFKQVNGEWKIWTQAPIEIQLHHSA